ncbi:hypothetical protein [Nocardioides daejeonensis]|uniref:hypothetical protein n=1 Tax=Nocardioides daejeonensis TaxID=1046556 RepID=UPI000D7491FC|nr:hypothetical protein [Nocardioides daejeonensis]
MSTPLRLLAFLAAAVVAFGAAAGVGKAVGPLDTETEKHGHSADSSATGHSADSSATGHGAHGESRVDEAPAGLSSSAAGHRLQLSAETAPAGKSRAIAFTITGPDGRPVTEYDVVHDKPLHLIAVLRDQSGFQHVHPTLDARGTWHVELDLTPGTWRLFADFSAHGTALTLGTDLQVAGEFTPVPAVAESRTAHVDGYDVTLAGDLTPGADTELTLRISRDGVPVTDLQPYLGAYGHLVALRAGDLAYLHVHPDGAPGDGATEPGPEVVFHTSVPSEGRYHLYLDFQHDGVVRTAAFTLGSRQARPTDSQAPTTEGTHDDAHTH